MPVLWTSSSFPHRNHDLTVVAISQRPFGTRSGDSTPNLVSAPSSEAQVTLIYDRSLSLPPLPLSPAEALTNQIGHLDEECPPVTTKPLLEIARVRIEPVAI